MIHPSYSDLMKVVNSGTEFGEEPVVNSRYSIVIATAKRARQIIAGDEPMIGNAAGKKPLSIAVEELNEGKVKILAEDASEEIEDLQNDFFGMEEDMDEREDFSEEDTEKLSDGMEENTDLSAEESGEEPFEYEDAEGREENEENN